VEVDHTGAVINNAVDKNDCVEFPDRDSVLTGAFNDPASDEEDTPVEDNEENFAEPTAPSEEGKAELSQSYAKM